MVGGRLAARPAARLEKVCWDALVLGRLRVHTIPQSQGSLGRRRYRCSSATSR